MFGVVYCAGPEHHLLEGTSDRSVTNFTHKINELEVDLLLRVFTQTFLIKSCSKLFKCYRSSWATDTRLLFVSVQGAMRVVVYESTYARALSHSKEFIIHGTNFFLLTVDPVDSCCFSYTFNIWYSCALTIFAFWKIR